MNSTPAVSVVLPFHRGGRFLEDAVESVLGQSFTDWELILVDNNAGLKPDTSRWPDKVKTIREQRPGAAWALNAGTAAASGRYVAFLDEDDLWMREKLAMQVEALDSRPDAGLCHTGLEGIDADGRVIGSRAARPLTYADVLADRGLWKMSCLMVRRELLVGVGGFDPTYTLAPDLDLGLRLLYFESGVFLDEVLLRYRYHGDNISHGYWLQGQEALRTLGVHRRQAFLERRWRVWAGAWRGVATVRHGYSRNAFARARRAVDAGRPVGEVGRHVAYSVAFSPTGPLGAMAARLVNKGRSKIWPEVDSWGGPAAPAEVAPAGGAPAASAPADRGAEAAQDQPAAGKQLPIS
ncbi:MAG: glycosyltransferase [Actinomycetota bacterium]|nr:glycosyltransferase [Actinomycetota bacterium]